MATLSTGLFQGVKNFSCGKKDSRTDVSVESLEDEGRVLGLYFSAHWCLPCRDFTPKLAEWYIKLTGAALKDKLEIVFVSSDRDEDAFDEYFDSMPWLGLPYDEREINNKLSKTFKVSGIPTLVFVNAKTGELINSDGCSVVTEDTNGDRFPWKPEKFDEIIHGEFVNNDGHKIRWDDYRGKTVGLYFSAHWCGPCRVFTPKLVTFYKKMKDAGKQFEVVFLSSDHDKGSFQRYLSEMPWYALPFDNKLRMKKLSRMFNVVAIPHLVLLDADTGKVITDCGRGMVSSDPEGKDFPWYPKPLELVHVGNVGTINEQPFMIWFTDGTDKQIETAKSAMEPVAIPYFKEHESKSDALIFRYTKSGDFEESLQRFIGVAAPFPVLAIVDVPNQMKYICDKSGSDLNEGVVRQFLNDYLANKLTGQEIED